MKKKIFIAFCAIVLLTGVLGGIKFLQINRMIAQGKEFTPPPTTVTTAPVLSSEWEQRLTAVGSLEAVQGVTVTAELSGKIQQIAFEPGAHVATGDLLVQQDISSEMAQLRADQAALALRKANFERAKELLAQKVATQAAYDQVLAEYKQAQAAIDTIQSIIAKKTIRAPFAGRLGIRLVNLGQILEAGQPIVSLQALDPIHVNFSMPQDQVSRIQLGLPVRIATDALSDDVVAGRITAINPQVDAATRNILIQATVDNLQERLRPGMYATVEVILPAAAPVLVIPTTAVLYAPYSDSVFVVAPQDGKASEEALVLRQQFVTLGEKRGDFITVKSGLEAGQTVVSTGAFKLRNGMGVVVDNTLAPAFTLTPRPDNA
jgi:membrane fusion protein (multidrug efflux system)